MLRKLLFCTLLLLFLLTACRPTEDTTVCDTAICTQLQKSDEETYGRSACQTLVYAYHATEAPQLLSQWDHDNVVYRAPYLFHLINYDGGWSIVSTAPDGAAETLWLDRSQLPEEKFYHPLQHTIFLAEETLYLLAQGSPASEIILVAAQPNNAPRIFPLEDVARLDCASIWNGRYYFLSGQALISLDTATGICTPMDVEPVGGLFYFDLFQIDHGMLWYLDADYARTACILTGVDLDTGRTTVQLDTDGWLRGGHVMQIHDGYLYYLSQEDSAATYTLWEIPLAVLRDGVPSWEALFSEGGAAQALARALIYDEHLPPAELLFGRSGLWIRYTTRADIAAALGFTPGAVQYLPYAH